MVEVTKVIQFAAKKRSGLTGGQADRYGQRIECLAEQLNRAYGGITQEDVVDDAKSPESPLHDYFDWDDGLASHQWRLRQAQKLFRSITVMTIDQAEEVATTRQRVNLTFVDPETEEPGRAYIAISVVDDDSDLRMKYLQGGIRELRSWLRKWERYEELSGQDELVREALELWEV